MMPDSIKVPSRAASFNDLQAEGRSRSRKGKQRDGAPAPRIALDPAAPKTWYLDVASPTGADMQAIGKVRRDFNIPGLQLTHHPSSSIYIL